MPNAQASLSAFTAIAACWLVRLPPERENFQPDMPRLSRRQAQRLFPTAAPFEQYAMLMPLDDIPSAAAGSAYFLMGYALPDSELSFDEAYAMYADGH